MGLSDEKTVLSDKLAELSTRAKEAEGRAAAARGSPRPTFKRTPRPRERMLRPELRSCANPLRRTRPSSRSGGMTCSARGTSTSRRFATTSTPSALSTTRIAPSGAPSTERTTQCSRSSSRTRRSRRRSTQCSTPNWRGRRQTSCPRPDLQLEWRAAELESRASFTLSCCAVARGGAVGACRRLHRASAARGSDRLVRSRPRAASTGGCSPELMPEPIQRPSSGGALTPALAFARSPNVAMDPMCRR